MNFWFVVGLTILVQLVCGSMGVYAFITVWGWPLLISSIIAGAITGYLLTCALIKKERGISS